MNKKTTIDRLLTNDAIRSIITENEEIYWLSALNLGRKLSVESLAKSCRIAFLLTIYALNEDDSKYLETAYKTLKNIDINIPEYIDIFDNIAGYDLEDKSILYYFYLGCLALKLNRTISARIDLAHFTFSEVTDEKWDKRVISGILQSLILLIRKSEGFKDIKLAIEVICKLQQEQSTFEETYLNQFSENTQTNEACSLLALYHTSKALTETATYLIDGYNYSGKNIKVVIRQHVDTALKLVDPSSRLNDIITIVSQALNLLIENSIWTHTRFHDKIKQLCKNKSEHGFIELLPSQTQALKSNLFSVASNAVVVEMPTSAGKTLLAEFNILVTKSLRSDARIVYIVPSRALVNQVYNDLREDLSDLDLNVERTASTNEVDPTENDFLLSEDIDVLVTTPEKLDLLIRRKHQSVEDVSLFIIDEAHTISNGSRGAKLELLISMLRQEKPESKYMLLSPFLPNSANILKEWLGGGNNIKIDWKPSEKLVLGAKVNKRSVVISTLKSPFTSSSIPETDKEYRNIFSPVSTSPKDRILEFTCKNFAKEDKALLVLCKGRGTTLNQGIKISNWISSPSSIPEEVQIVQKYMREEIGCDTSFTELLSKGVTVHHAGLSDESKLLVEHLIRKKLIKCICATTTIAEGVNFPVSSVYFDTYIKGDHDLSVNDFWNIAGRAGRTLVDDIGKIILPFNTDLNKQKGKALISRSANQLVSVLSQLFINRYDILSKLQQKNGIDQLIYSNAYEDSFTPLFQYFVHLLNVSNNEYISDVEDLFKDSLAFHILSSESEKLEFINLCRKIYEGIETKYANQKGVLKFADKTGFSVPSVLKMMTQQASKKNISDPQSWIPENLFNQHNPSSLSEKIDIIASLKETGIGTESKKGPFNSELAAKIIIEWVNGAKLKEISGIHPYFEDPDISKQVTQFVTYMNSLRFKTSWGLSALEGIVNGNTEEIKDSYIPSYVYYGVKNKKALALRMLGIPRCIADSLSNIIAGEINTYSYSKIRNKIRSLNTRDWDEFIPKTSSLNGLEWKMIVDILMK